MNLLCFPYAGGSSVSYRGLGDSIDFINVKAYDLPGRGKRVRDQPLESIEAIVEDLFEQIRPELDRPYAFYGHSLGACLAYLLIKRVVSAQLPLPAFLFVSGRRGPSVSEEDNRHLLPKKEFIDMLRKLGGCPRGVLEDPELFDFFEPILRADFRAIATYRYRETQKLAVPILVMIGDDDDISIDAAEQWQLETTQPITLKRFFGNHFFILDHWTEIRQLMLKSLAPSNRSLNQGYDRQLAHAEQP